LSNLGAPEGIGEKGTFSEGKVISSSFCILPAPGNYPPKKKPKISKMFG
jgi:hypothetical protein